jgi:hypothetical protein
VSQSSGERSTPETITIRGGCMAQRVYTRAPGAVMLAG